MPPPGPGAEPPPAPGPAELQLRLAYDRTRLANERTYAAWLRTGLSVAAGGIAVAHLVPEPTRNSLAALGLGAMFVGVGIVVMSHGARDFARGARTLDVGDGGPSRQPTRFVYPLTAAIALLLLAVLYLLWSSHQDRAPGSANRHDRAGCGRATA